MDSLPTTSTRTRESFVLKAIRTRELRGEGNRICDIFDDDKCVTVGDTSKLLKALRNRELRSQSKVNIYGNLFEQSRQKWVYQKDLKYHKGCVNAVEFSPTEEYIVSGGDDCDVLIWRTVNCCVESSPQPIAAMDTQHESNIFALRFSLHTERLYSAGNDHQLLIHDIQTRTLLRSFTADKCIFRISNHPINDSVLSIACEDGHVYIYDLRLENYAVTKIAQQGPVYSVEYNRQQPNLMAVCSTPHGLVVYDLRKTKDHYARAGPFTKNAICGEWSLDGRAIFAIMSGGNPIYFNLECSDYTELEDPGYKNLCTVKSCTFAGSDYLLTGSDDWNIYVWKVPHKWDGEPIKRAFSVLKGHRSIVNHIRYGERSNLMVSCGVEKIVKCWSANELPDSYKNPPRRAKLGRIYMDRFDSVHEPDSMDEDLEVLHNFDRIYEQALRSDGPTASDFSLGSSDEDEESLISDISLSGDSSSEISNENDVEEFKSSRRYIRNLSEDYDS